MLIGADVVFDGTTTTAETLLVLIKYDRLQSRYLAFSRIL